MKKAMLIVKRRVTPMLAAIVEYNQASGRKWKVLASEPIQSNFGNADLVAAARRLVPQVPGYEVILPTGVDLEEKATMAGHQEINTLDEALHVAREFAASFYFNEGRAEAFAGSWFDAGKDYDASSPDDLRSFLARKFGVQESEGTI